jgi:hypothetical protein
MQFTSKIMFSLNSNSAKPWLPLGYIPKVKQEQQNPVSLEQVLKLANLDIDYGRFRILFEKAQGLFAAGDNHKACSVLHSIWMDNKIIPALLLSECFYAQELILPNWNVPCLMQFLEFSKEDGSVRPINVPNKRSRICMGVVNTLFQTSCLSWDKRSTGFRIGYNTDNAMLMLCNKARQLYKDNDDIVLTTFDIKGAFNAVNVKQLFNALELNNLPHQMKYLVYGWQDSQPLLLEIPGLKQGVPYSPTLFAWYMDRILVKNSTFVCYADNFADVFTSMDEARQAVKNAEIILDSHGLSIKPSSVQFIVVNKNQQRHSIHFKWLGHSLYLPKPHIVFNKAATYQPDLALHKHTFLTSQDWEHKLKTLDWLNTVLLDDWRMLPQQKKQK